MKHLFTEHPVSVGETYLQHLGSAWYFAWQLTMGALNCLVHGLFPFLFEKSGSGRVADLYDRMIINRSRLAPESAIRQDLAGSADTTDIQHSTS
jgi:hypothetical protein